MREISERLLFVTKCSGCLNKEGFKSPYCCTLEPDRLQIGDIYILPSWCRIQKIALGYRGCEDGAKNSNTTD